MRMQDSVAVFQPEDTEEFEALQRALTKAQRQMLVPTLLKHDVAIKAAKKEEANVQAYADAENLLQRLRAQATAVPEPPVPPQRLLVCNNVFCSCRQNEKFSSRWCKNKV